MKPVNGQSGSDFPTLHCRRKWLAAMVTVAVALAVTAAFGQAWVIAKVSFYMGEVGFKKADTEDWTRIALGQPLFTGDAVRTAAESRLEVKVGEEGVLVRIDENAELEISARGLQDWKGPGTRANLKKGRLWSNVQRLAADRENLTIETPTVLAAVRGTVFRFDIPDSLTTMLRVYDGEVEVRQNPTPPGGALGVVGPPQEVAPPGEVSAQQWLELVTANQQLVFTYGQDPVITEFDPNQDAQLDWVAWNQQRDAALEPPPADPLPEKSRNKEKEKYDL